MTHPMQEQLSLYLDGELDPADTGRLEAHLADCPTCGALLTELRGVMSRAQALEHRPPRADLWPGIAAAIGATPAPRRRFSLTVPQLLAAGVALMVLSGGVVAGALHLRSGGSRPVAASESPPTIERSVSATPEHGYEAAIRRLETKLLADRGQLDSMTVRVVEEKLQLIDRAILEAERALAADPANAYLTAHLTDTRMRKLDLLRHAIALSRAVS
jgi:predicted anti-sigma-YlaC factor YlaD